VRARIGYYLVMDIKRFFSSSEVVTGLCLMVTGLLAQIAGIHNVLSMAMAPFGLGLILSEVLARFGRDTRERVKIRIRRDDR
jgi:hypothetical protein